MNWDLKWTRVAENELTELWVAANSDLRLAVTKASHAIDQALRNDPLNQGESRPEDERIMFHRPLAIVYQVIEETRRVRVLHDWIIRRKVQS